MTSIKTPTTPDNNLHRSIIDGRAFFEEAGNRRVEAVGVQIELLSQASTERRLELGLSLSQTALKIARQAIAQANPLVSEEEQKLLFVEVTYGKEVADRVRAYLAARQQ